MRKHARHRYEQDILLSRYQPEGPFPLVLVLDHLKAGFNVGKIIRTANVFGVREVHLIGIPPFDPGPTKGALRHTRTRSFATFAESHAHLTAQGYTLYALELLGQNVVGRTEFPEKTAFVMGHEEFGLSFAPEEFPDVRYIHIPQFGNVDSLNVSVAASLACFEYLRQRDFALPEGYVRPTLTGKWVELPSHPGELP
jgi:tRNA G18 (ribose-2'-O)-methylase SpoU